MGSQQLVEESRRNWNALVLFVEGKMGRERRRVVMLLGHFLMRGKNETPARFALAQDREVCFGCVSTS
jgi:hypothetical protein